MVLNSAIFNIFQNQVQFGKIFDGLQNFGGAQYPKPPQYAPDFMGEEAR